MVVPPKNTLSNMSNLFNLKKEIHFIILLTINHNYPVLVSDNYDKKNNSKKNNSQ